MKKEFIPYEQALALKELGFDEPCFIYWVYDGVEITYSTSHNKSGWSIIGFKNSQMLKKAGLCTSPTFSQAFRWFRENYQMVFCYEPCLKKDLTYIFFIYIETTGEKVFVIESKYNKEAELACLIKLIQIANEKTI